ncbi:MAG: ribose ABC transporter permease [Clostridiaceae bacterium]|nr:ribose ABC transporter permease [Clostridiaceae bacterium]
MKLKELIPKFGIWFALVTLIIVFSLTTETFLTRVNLFNIARQVSVIGICAVGMTFVMLMGAMDISVGAIIGVTAVTTATLLKNGVNIVLACLVSLCLGVLIGLFIALVVNKINIPAIIVTLALMTALRGVAFLITGGLPVYGIPKSFLFLGQGYISFIPVPVLIMFIVFILGYILLEKTIIGRMIYGTGGNEQASRLSGVSVNKVKYFVFAVHGFLAALAGIILLSRVNSGQPGAGTGYEMDIITGCVLGGISVSGGEGKISGVIVGVMTIGVLSNGMVLLGINEFWQMIAKGTVLLIAVIVDKTSKTTGSKLSISEANAA